LKVNILIEKEIEKEKNMVNMVNCFLKVNSQLIFEGEYYNDKKWNGIVKDKNNNIYELKNENGYFLEINNTNNIFYVGEYINGALNGKGKEYRDKKLRFEGEYIKEKRNGKGKEYKEDKLIVDGEYLYGHIYKGKEYNDSQLIFEGEYLFNKKWNGKEYEMVI